MRSRWMPAWTWGWLLAGCLSASPALAEDITLTTYYPAPFGVYDTLVAEKLVDYNAGAYNVPPVPGTDWFVDPSAGGNNNNISAVFRGKVGIGATSPGAKLDVAGGLLISADSPEAAFHTGLQRVGGETVLWYGGGSGNLQIKSGQPGTPGDRVTISPNGAVGIGTGNPQSRLHVSAARYDPGLGDVGFGRSNFPPAELWLQGGSDDTAVIRSDTNVTTGRLIFSDGQLENLLTLRNDGNIGMGTADPSANLHIQQPDFAYAKLESQRRLALLTLEGGGTVFNAYGELELRDNGYVSNNPKSWRITHVRGSNPSQDNHKLFTSFDNQPMLTVDTTGSVGIGTTAPSAKLSVFGRPGHITTPGYFPIIRAQSTGGNSPSIELGDDVTYWRWLFDNRNIGGYQNTYKLQWHDNVALNTPLTVTPLEGNVGIGTETPDRRLYVNGSGFFNADGTYIELHSRGDSILDITQANNTGGKRALSIHASSNSGNPIEVYRHNGIAYDGLLSLNTAGDGSLKGKICASNVACDSDARLKEELQPLTGALERLQQLRGLRFRWNETAQDMGLAARDVDIGVIAQEVEAVYPELVTTSPTTGYKTVHYDRLTAVLLEAIKELKHENDLLKQRVEALEQP